MSAKYKSPSFLLPNELNTSANTANDTGVNSLYSMDFDSSSSDYIDIGTISSLNAQQNFSISLWFNENVRNLNGVLFSSGTSVSNDITINASYGTLKINVGGTRNVNITSYSSNVWYHVVLTVENTTAKVYINDGSPTTVTVGSNTSSSSGNNAKIGDLSFASGYYFDGQIDEVAIFNKALNDNEIAALYGGTSPNIYPSNLIASNLNPIAYYPLGEQAQNSGYPSATGNEWQFPNGVLQDYVMDFDGVNDFVDLGDLQPSTTSLSISAWAYKTDTSNASIIGRGASVDYGIFVYGGNLQFGLNAGGWTTISTTLPTLNKWFHVLATWNGSIMKLSVNGGTPVTTSKTGTITYTSNNTTIGKNSTLSGFEWDGKMSNLAIWNSDQSTNIANIYNNGSPQTSYTVTPQNWWKLNATSVYTPSAPNYTTALDFGGSQSVDTNYTGLDGLSKATISLWVKPDVASANGTIFNARDGSAVGMNCQFFTSKTYLYFTGSINVISANYTPPFSDNLWANLVIVFDGTLTGNDRIKLYANGETKVIDTYNGTIPAVLPTSSTSLKIAESFNGQVSNFAIFNSALTSSQVSTLFNFGTPETNISFSPQAWWKLDDQTAITDSSGNGNTGTNNGATDISSGVAVTPSWKIPTALTIPTINYTTALDFPGSSDYIDYGNPSNLNIGENITVSAWFKNNGTAGQQIISKGIYTGEIGSGFPYEIQVRSNGGIAWQYYGTNTQGSTSGRRVYILSPTSGASAVDYRDNIWHHVVGTKNGVNSKLYIDGVLITNLSQGGTERDYMVTNTSPVRIGANSSGASEFIGEISNVAIWNSALTDGGVSVGSIAGGQIAGLYNSGQPETSMSYSPLSWWKLDDVTTGIQDSGSASNNGTIVGQVTQVTSDVTSPGFNIPVNGVSTTLPSTALQQSDLQFDSPYSNYSLSFDGSDKVVIPNTSNIFDFGTNDFTVSLWCKGDGVAASQYIIGSTDSSFRIGRHVSIPATGKGGVRFRIGSSFNTITAVTTNIDDGNWHNVIVKRESGGVSIFTDGQAQQLRLDNGTDVSTPYTMNDSISVGSNLFIGSYTAGAEFWIGKVDETAFWSVALTEAQVLEIYNNGKPKDLSTFSGTAPISWWRLGENAYFDNNSFIVPNSISGAPNGTGSGTITTMISADAPGTYANGIGTNLDILDRVGDAALSTSNSQSYNMIPSDISPYVPQYVGDQIANNSSMTFDGVDDYFNAGNPTELQITGELSISLWFKTSTTPATSGYLISKGVSPYTSRNFAIWFSNNNTVRAAVNGVSGLVTSPASNYNDDNWHHCVFTFTPSTSTILYIDGSAVVTNTTSIPSAITNNTSNLEIGRYVSEYFTGEIDEVAIWNTALNAGQIYNDIYQPTASAPGNNQTADLVNNPNLPNPVAWYRMGD